MAVHEKKINITMMIDDGVSYSLRSMEYLLRTGNAKNRTWHVMSPQSISAK